MINIETSHIILLIITSICMMSSLRICYSIVMYLERGIITDGMQIWLEIMEYFGKLIRTIRQKQHREHRNPTEKQPITLLEQREEKKDNE